MWGCADRGLEWDLAFDSPDLEAQAVRLDARILAGPCPGTDVLWDEVVHPTTPDTLPPSLPPGSYCFGARAGNAACEWFASGERTLELPTEERVTITLSAQMATSICPGTMCSEGMCANVSGTPQTCIGGGCVQTCDSDCVASCAGGGCTQVCTGGAATDCSFSCAGGDCTVRCEDSTDCTASCTTGNCGMECTGAITGCTFQCLGGGCSYTCEDPTNCTTSCLPMDCSGP